MIKDFRLNHETTKPSFHVNAPSHTPGNSVNKTQISPAWPFAGGTRTVFCNYTAARLHFPGTCAPKRIKGDNCFTGLICVRPENCCIWVKYWSRQAQMFTNLRGPLRSHSPQSIFTAYVSLGNPKSLLTEWQPSLSKIQLQPVPRNLQRIAVGQSVKP